MPRPVTATWRLTQPAGSPAKPTPRTLENWTASLSQLGYSAILPAHAGRDAAPGNQLRLHYAGGETLNLRLSGLVDGRMRYLWCDRYPDAVWLLDLPRARAAHRYGAALLTEMPRLLIHTAAATGFELQTGDKRLVVRRQGKDWRMTEPAVSQALWVPPAMPPMKPQSQALHYLDQFQVIAAGELLANDAKRQAAAAKALATPATAITIAMSDGEPWHLTVSGPVPGTDLVYLKANDQILVVASAMTDLWQVTPSWFFDPQAQPSEDLQW
jgi:hypothetical protein